MKGDGERERARRVGWSDGMEESKRVGSGGGVALLSGGDGVQGVALLLAGCWMLDAWRIYCMLCGVLAARWRRLH